MRKDGEVKENFLLKSAPVFNKQIDEIYNRCYDKKIYYPVKEKEVC